MNGDQFRRPADGEPASNPTRFVNYSAAEFAAHWGFTPDRKATRASLEDLVAANMEKRRLGADGIQDRDQQLTLAFLQHHKLEGYPS